MAGSSPVACRPDPNHDGVRGPEFTELFAHMHRPDQVAELDRAVDAALRRRPIGQILADQQTLDARILDHLARRVGRQPCSGQPPANSAGEPPYTASMG